MRIELTNISNKSASKKNITKKEKINFNEMLKNISENTPSELTEFELENISSDDIKNLTNLIEKLGNDLSDSPTIENFNSYKKALKLLIEMVKKNFENKETISRISLSKQKLYKTIEVIDQNLSKIAELILCQEKNRLSYLNLTNNIKGLIVDLLL